MLTVGPVVSQEFATWVRKVVFYSIRSRRSRFYMQV